jgi:pyruvate ferredoxin oxidoreductase alpha subunit
MLIRDSGVVQLFVENAQEAYDMTILAPRLAERPEVLLPVLVCQDGFTITHSAEPVELLADDAVRRFVGEYQVPNPLLDLEHPTTQGPFAMPDYYFELRRGQVAALEAALPAFEDVAVELAGLTGRPLSAVERYRLDDARTVVVALGSTAGTLKEGVDALRDEGVPVGLLRIVAFRPFPREAVAEALADADEVVVLDRADSPGGAPPLFAELAAALYGTATELRGHVYGLGGRDFHPDDLRGLVAGDAPAYLGLRSERCLG